MHTISRLQIYLMLLLCLLLQLTVLDHLKLFGVKPDLLLIIVVFFGLFLGRGVGMEAGIIAGLGKDLYALDFFGINALILAATGMVAGILGAQFSRESNRTQFLLVLMLSSFSMILHFIIVSVFSKWVYLGFGEYLAGSVIPTGIYTALVSVPVFIKLQNTYGLRSSEEYL